MTIPVVLTAAGAAPQSPTSLHDQIIALATAADPGLTANLPGTLIEDIASTDTAALTLIDSAWVETINSVTPYGANMFLLNQLGQIYGVQQGLGSNTAVYVVFSGTAGFVISSGVIVSDGAHQYVTQDATVIGTGGTSNTVYCVATNTGSWGVPPNTVTTISSSIPTGITLTVNNPLAGIPSTSVQTPEDFRSQVLGAGLVACTGTPQAVKTALQNVPGVVQSLISVQQVTVSSVAKWKVLVGGGDTYAVANAIFNTIGDPNILTGASAGGTTVNVTVSNTPDSYLIKYVQPLQQATSVQVYWNTSASGVSNAAIQSLCAAPIQSYINGLGPGQPINTYEIEYLFQVAVQPVLPTNLITYIYPRITIAGSVVTPPAGSGVVTGNSEGYYYVDSASVTTTQGTAP